MKIVVILILRGSFDMNKPIWQGYTVRSRMYSANDMPMVKTQHIAQCGNESLGLMRTLHLKFCPVCDSWIIWQLKKGQKALL